MYIILERSLKQIKECTATGVACFTNNIACLYKPDYFLNSQYFQVSSNSIADPYLTKENLTYVFTASPLSLNNPIFCK